MRFFALALQSLAAVIMTASWSLAAELVMVEKKGCHWCETWLSEIGPIYPLTDEGKRAPLRMVNIKSLPDDITFSSRPVYTPTFILVHDGQELGRIEGYPGEDFFWPMIKQLLDDHPQATVPQL